MMEDELRNLMLQSLDGHAAAYQQFLQQVSTPLRAYLRRRLASAPDEVEDLLQETLLAIHAQRHTYRREALLTPWLYAVARYKLIDYLRRRSRQQALHVPLELDEAGDEALWLAADEQAAQASTRDLNLMLDKLPAHQRLPIIHTKLEGKSVAEAAVLSGMSVSAVKVGVHRGIKALAKMWRENT